MCPAASRCFARFHGPRLSGWPRRSDLGRSNRRHIRLLRALGSFGHVCDLVRSTGRAQAAARGVATDSWRLPSPGHVDGRGTSRRWGAPTGLAGLGVLELSGFVHVAPLGVLFDKASPARGRSHARRLLGRLANLQMEPTRPTVCAIMGPRRAAHLDR